MVGESQEFSEILKCRAALEGTPVSQGGDQIDVIFQHFAETLGRLR